MKDKKYKHQHSQGYKEPIVDKSEEQTESELEQLSKSDVAEDVAKMADDDRAELQEEVVSKEKYDKLSDDYLRLMAEYDNYRRRTLKEKSELIKNGGEKTIKELLPVIDDFELAIKNFGVSDDLEGLRKGVELIHTKFVEYLAKQGVKPIDAHNQPFNEELHEAIAVIPAEDEDKKGNIIDCVKTGYTLNDKVIRHSSVVVAK